MNTQNIQRVFDWKINLDPRSLAYKIDKVVPVLKARSIMWKRNTWLDQGQEGACTGFAAAHCLATTPRRYVPIVNADGQALYLEAKKRDEWPGENYDGSSVTGAMKALADRGDVVRYLWATTMDELVHAVGYIGPVVIGIDWHRDMMDPDSAGYLHATGPVVGGHAILVGGVDVAKRRFFLYNSWGKSWGVNGGAWVSFEDMASLMAAGGEFAVITKTKQVRTA